MVEIAFVCVANDQIGWGHLHRVIALYDACVTTKYETLNIIVEGQESGLADRLGERNHVFFEDRSELIGSLERSSDSISTVILDHPVATYDDVDRIAKAAGPLVLFYSVKRKLIEDYWVKKFIIPRHDGITPPESLRHVTMVGMEYTPLRPRFYRAKPHRAVTSISSLFICLGGSQHVAALNKVLRMLADLNFNGEVKLVLGESSEQVASQYYQVSFDLNVFVGVEENQLISLIDASDAGLVSSGTVAQECFSRGLVCGLVDVAADQKGLSRAYASLGLCLSIDLNSQKSIHELITLDKGRWSRITKCLTDVDYASALTELVGAIAG